MEADINSLDYQAIGNRIATRYADLAFDPQWHSYSIDGVKLMSVSKFVGLLHEPFDKENIAAKFAEKHGRTKEDVIAEWDASNKESTTLGHGIHSAIEDYWLRGTEIEIPVADADSHMDAAMKTKMILASAKEFMHKMKEHYNCVGIELKIFSKDLGLAGTIDGLFQRKDTGAIEIFDWKTNKKIETGNSYGKKFLDFDYIDDCNFSHYAFQLGSYRYILETTLGLRIGAQRLIHFRHDGQVDRHACPYYGEQIGYLLKNSHIWRNRKNK